MTRPSRVVLVHGWSVDSRIWGRLQLDLGEDHEVLVPDLPGHRGAALDLGDRPPSCYHEHATEHLAHWWAEAGAGDSPVVAWAWGGQVVVDAIAQGWISPSSVALVCGAAPFQTEETRRAALADWPRLARRLVRSMTVQPLSDEQQVWIARLMTDTSLVAVASVQGRRWQPPEPFALPDRSIAILGAADRLTPPEPNRELAERWGATVHELADVGHLPFLEDPAAFTQLIEDWLQRASMLNQPESREDPA